MTRCAVRILLLALTTACLACGGPELVPNGDQHVLMFLDRGARLGEGLADEVLLPRSHTLSSGCGKLDLVCDRKTFTFDFKGTTLEVSPPPGMQAQAVLEEEGYVVRLTCNASFPDGVGSVAFRVLDATGAPRYADSMSIGCEKADGLDLVAVYKHYAIGSRPHVEARLLKGDHTLDGIGWSLVDPQQTLRFDGTGLSPDGGDPEKHSVFTFEAVDAGSGAAISAGNVSAPLPFDVVADSAWTFEAQVSPCSATSIHAALSANVSGSPVGLPESGCGFTVTPADGGMPETQEGRSCDACIDAPPKGTLCVRLRGHEACTPYGR